MRVDLRKPVVLVWLVLVLLTLVSWGIGVEERSGRGQRPSVAIAAVLAIAFFKTQLVGSYFMELRGAPLALRLVFAGWVVGVGTILIAMYLLL